MQIIVAVHALKRQFTLELNSQRDKPQTAELADPEFASESPLTDAPKIKTGFQVN